MRALLILPVVLIAACRSPAGGPGGVSFAPVAPVAPLGDKVRASVAVLNKDRRVRANESLALDFKLVNASASDAFVYNELDPGFLVVIQIAGAGGKYVETQTPPKVRRTWTGKYHYACLPPGGFVGTTYLIRPDDPRWDLAAGRYWVRVVYRNGFEPCLASPLFGEKDVEDLKQRAVVTLLTGLVASNVEEFEVE